MAPDLSLYRPNVGVVLFHKDGRVWYGRRAGAAAPQNWQFPQGGIDAGEAPLAAAARELAEETGVKSVRLLGQTEDWVTYDFPPEMLGKRREKWRGQKQLWFAFAFDGPDSEIDLTHDTHAEFDAWRWAPLSEAVDLVVPFKRHVYEAVVRAFSKFA
jgi:putative (di)nucleoside polyphosphate hydrolase